MKKILKLIQGAKPEFRSLTLKDVPGQLKNQY